PRRCLSGRTPGTGAMILMFGAGGQLGSALHERAAAAGVPLRGLTRAEADIADPVQVTGALREAGARVVVNAAAYAKVDLAETERDEAERTNTTGAAVLAEQCARAGRP